MAAEDVEGTDVSNKPIVLLASFPDIQSAIKIGRDGMRIQLDIPESEMDQTAALLALRGKVLVVTVQEQEDGT